MNDVGGTVKNMICQHVKSKIFVINGANENNEENVCKIEFYECADKTDQFHIQWYHKEGDRKFVGTISFH